MSDSERTHTVELVREDGSMDVIDEVPADETILSATDSTTIDMRYGCREGRCVSCTGKLLDGDVDYLEEPKALTDDRREDGFALLCVATPADDCRVRIGKSVLGEAFPTIWQSESPIGPNSKQFEQAREEIKDIDGDDAAVEDHLEEMCGTVEHFDNLLEVREAYDRAIETVNTVRHH
jgi:ferredoxin